MTIIRPLFIFFIIAFIFGCTEKITYSGKIITQNDLSNLNITNKNELIKKFGRPSYIDKTQKKFFYYTEMKRNKNFFNETKQYSYLFVFEIDTNDNIIGTEAIDLLKNDLNKYNKIETQNNIVKRGLLEKIFGGVGPSQLPNSP